MDIDEMISVLEAYKEGKTIQLLTDRGEWVNNIAPAWDFADCEYRVKPEPREFWLYRDGPSCAFLVSTGEPIGNWHQVIKVREVTEEV